MISKLVFTLVLTGVFFLAGQPLQLDLTRHQPTEWGGISADELTKILTACPSFEIGHDFETGGYIAICDWPGQPMIGQGKTPQEAYERMYDKLEEATP